VWNWDELRPKLVPGRMREVPQFSAFSSRPSFFDPTGNLMNQWAQCGVRAAASLLNMGKYLPRGSTPTTSLPTQRTVSGLVRPGTLWGVNVCVKRGTGQISVSLSPGRTSRHWT